ncbi:MAG: hypothetical protein H7Y18_10370 [Clostridiaceae bacterium]|nr:hypothetical protein [Clostridiaceae bacterium]
MILDKTTGNLIIDENHIIKARMSIQEIKNSNIKDLLTEESKKKLEYAHHHISLKTIVVDGIDIDVDILTLNDRIIEIQFAVDAASRKCNFNQAYGEFGQSLEKHKVFMRKMLDVQYIDEDVDFQGGYAQLRSEIRSPSVRIRVSYLYKVNNTI